MKHSRKTFTGLLPLVLVSYMSFPVLPSPAQIPATPTPGAQAWSATQQVLSQDLSTVTAQALYSGEQALASKMQAAASKKQGAVAALPQGTAATAKALLAPPRTTAAGATQTIPSQAEPVPNVVYKARRTLFVEIGENRLRLEAPEKMCFLDRTSPMQQGIFLALSTVVEQHHDQVVLGIFMQCDNITSPSAWVNGMPDAGFVTWLNPAIGETTPMNRQDYLDMREASFPQYAKGRAIGNKPDKAVHRNDYNVSLAFNDIQALGDGLKHNNTSIVATTLLRQVPIEITLHYEDDAYAGKIPPQFPQAYAAMDKLVAQQITLNE